MTPDEIRAVVARWNGALSRHDSVALSAEYADDCRVESPIFGRVLGRVAVEKQWRTLFATFPNHTHQIEALLISDDSAVWTGET
jgi:ketosteroid isomerase-like protein